MLSALGTSGQSSSTGVCRLLRYWEQSGRDECTTECLTQGDMRTKLNVQPLREKRTHLGANDRGALTRYRHIAILRRANVTPMHHIRFFRSFVMANTAESDWCPYHDKLLRNGRGISHDD